MTDERSAPSQQYVQAETSPDGAVYHHRSDDPSNADGGVIKDDRHHCCAREHTWRRNAD